MLKSKEKKAAAKVKADGSDAEPPPATHPNKREPKPRTLQVYNSAPQLCWWHQGYYNGGWFCEDFVDTKRGCKHTHTECKSFNEYRA